MERGWLFQSPGPDLRNKGQGGRSEATSWLRKRKHPEIISIFFSNGCEKSLCLVRVPASFSITTLCIIKYIQHNVLKVILQCRNCFNVI
jgi:hypothetical protein